MRSQIILRGLLMLPALILFACHGARPSGLGVRDGRLAPCPSSPNCVSSQSPDAAHKIDPLPLDGTAGKSIAGIKAMVMTMPRTAVITETGTYLHVEFTSALFRFVDDVEFHADASANVVHVRSASRLGKSDLGVNRKRIEAIRSALSAGGANTTRP